MLFQRLPMTPSSGSGSHDGQKTGASMRFASRCQPWASAQRTFCDTSCETSAVPQPASANASSARTPSRFTAPLKPVNRDPGPGAAVTRLEMVGESRPLGERVVEGGLTRIDVARGEHAVGHGARHDHEADAFAPE